MMSRVLVRKGFSLTIVLAFVLAMVAGCCDVCKKTVDEAKMYADQAAALAAKADSAARNAEMAAADAKASADKAEATADRAEAAVPKAEASLMKKMIGGLEIQTAIPIRHVWDTLRHEGCEKKGYGMYTYVLFGRRVDNLVSLDPEIAKCYEKLLYEITMSTPTTREDAGLMKERTNIFYIPSKVDYSGKFNLQDYNSSLAMTYIVRLINMIQDDSNLVKRLNTEPGPFLISVPYRLGKISKGHFYLLYVDLSSLHPAAIEEIVVAYKNYITTEGVDIGIIKEFHSRLINFANFFLKFDDYVKIGRAEAKEWRRQIYKEK